MKALFEKIKQLLLSFLHWVGHPIIFVPFAFLTALFATCVFPQYNKEMKTMSGISQSESLRTLDVRRGYSLDTVKSLFTVLNGGPVEGMGLRRYEFVASKVDMAFPLVYTIMAISIFAFFIKRIWPKKEYWVFLALLPVLTGLVDVWENSNTVHLINDYLNDQTIDAGKVKVASAVNLLKHTLVVLSGVGIIVLGGIWARRILSPKKESASSEA